MRVATRRIPARPRLSSRAQLGSSPVGTVQCCRRQIDYRQSSIAIYVTRPLFAHPSTALQYSPLHPNLLPSSCSACPTPAISHTPSSSRRTSSASSATTSSLESRELKISPASVPSTARKLLPFPSIPLASTTTVSDVTKRATSSASSRKSKTSPSLKPFALSPKNSASLSPKPATRRPEKPRKPASVANSSTSTSAPSPFFRNVFAAPRAPTPASTSPDAVSTTK